MFALSFASELRVGGEGGNGSGQLMPFCFPHTGAATMLLLLLLYYLPSCVRCVSFSSTPRVIHGMELRAQLLDVLHRAPPKIEVEIELSVGMLLGAPGADLLGTETCG